MNMLTSLRDMLSTTPSITSLGKGGSAIPDPSQGASDFAQMLDQVAAPPKAIAGHAAPVMLDMPAAPDMTAAPVVAPVALDIPATPHAAPMTAVAPAALDMPAAPIVQAKADATVLPATPEPLALPTAAPETAAQDIVPLPSVADDQPTDAAAPSKTTTPVMKDATIASPVTVATTARDKPASPSPSIDPASALTAAAPTTRLIASEPVVRNDDGDADDADAQADDAAPPSVVVQPLANAVPLVPPIAVAPTTPQATEIDSAPAPISTAPTAPKASVQSPIAAETVAPDALPIAPAKPEQAISLKSRPANASPVPATDAQAIAPEAAVASPDIAPMIPHAKAPASMPATAIAPQAATPSPAQPVTDALASLVAPAPVSRDVAIPSPVVAPVTGPVAAAPATPTSAIVTAQPVDAPLSPVATTLAPVAAPASTPVQASSPLDATIQPDATIPTAAPVKPASFERVSRSDAVSLLQLARDHMAGRVAPSGKDEVARPSITAGAPSTDAASLPASGIGRIDSAAIQPSAPTMQPATSTQTTMAVVNLSASLGAQVVDMGVSGQWIDGLARDIAGLSANGAQGRFQIQADQLGPVQVDIRPGDGGSSVVLTVENAAAEAALRRDSDQLRFDVGGAAARISDVRIERGPMAADATRSDQSATQQQSTGQGQASNWQGQNPAQQQARSQARENPFPNPKGAGDAVVINHGQTGDGAGEPARARYA
ncbi:hypothetical protein [Sphingobium sp.]|uniref:hypothetical protein n=1 Tax=Sphingobium sp. TaxID=1912891 RepID=UPI003BB623F8